MVCTAKTRSSGSADADGAEHLVDGGGQPLG
jgi:hypothetical protein